MTCPLLCPCWISTCFISAKGYYLSNRLQGVWPIPPKNVFSGLLQTACSTFCQFTACSTVEYAFLGPPIDLNRPGRPASYRALNTQSHTVALWLELETSTSPAILFFCCRRQPQQSSNTSKGITIILYAIFCFLGCSASLQEHY